MAVITKDGNGRVALTTTTNISGVILEEYLDGDRSSAKIRPTNTTAWISTVPGTGATIAAAELEAPKAILLQNGPKGGFTQGGIVANADADYLVSGNVRAVITTS